MGRVDGGTVVTGGFVVGLTSVGSGTFFGLAMLFAYPLTAKKMVDCRWLKPVLVAQFEFVEWTGENHLRHTRFMGLRDDKRPKEVVRER